MESNRRTRFGGSPGTKTWAFWWTSSRGATNQMQMLATRARWAFLEIGPWVPWGSPVSETGPRDSPFSPFSETGPWGSPFVETGPWGSPFSETGPWASHFSEAEPWDSQFLLAGSWAGPWAGLWLWPWAWPWPWAQAWAGPWAGPWAQPVWDSHAEDYDWLESVPKPPLEQLPRSS